MSDHVRLRSQLHTCIGTKGVKPLVAQLYTFSITDVYHEYVGVYTYIDTLVHVLLLVLIVPLVRVLIYGTNLVLMY
jgi:hypothetical protein